MVTVAMRSAVRAAREKISATVVALWRMFWVSSQQAVRRPTA